MPHKAFFISTMFLTLFFFTLSGPVYGQITMSLDVSQGSIGSMVTVSGLTLPFSRVNVYFESLLVASTMSNASGFYEASFFVPMVNTGDYNIYVENMDTFEKASQLFTVTYGVDSLRSDLESIKGDTLSIQSSLDTISSRLQLLDSINNGVSQALDKLDNINDNVELLDDFVRQSFNNLQSYLESIEYSISNLSQDHLEISSKIDGLVPILDGIGSSLSQLSSDIDLLMSSISALSEAIDSLSGSVDGLSQDMTSRFDGISNDIAALEDKIPGPDMTAPILSGLSLIFTLAVLALLFKEFYLK